MFLIGCMQIEIPEVGQILNIVTAFVIGMFALFLYYKIRPYININKVTDIKKEYLSRLERCENEIIDMKLRLDVVDMGDKDGLQGLLQTQDKKEEIQKDDNGIVEPREEIPSVSREEKYENNVDGDKRMPNLGYNDAINHILQLITDKNMTSRDIQITIGRTREHTSRLMKKLFEDEYVQRNTNTKPYTYSITEKGREKIGLKK